MANAGTQGVFVEATILAPNGQVQVYNPLVINGGYHAGCGAGARRRSRVAPR